MLIVHLISRLLKMLRKLLMKKELLLVLK